MPVRHDLLASGRACSICWNERCAPWLGGPIERKRIGGFLWYEVSFLILLGSRTRCPGHKKQLPRFSFC